VTISGFDKTAMTVQLSFGKSLDKNGSVNGLTLAPAAN